jgi:hypothetical protein
MYMGQPTSNPNGTALCACAALQLVQIVELKWLLAGEGVHVHVERLQADPAYARECLCKAQCSLNPTVRRLAQRMQASIEAPAAT